MGRGADSFRPHFLADFSLLRYLLVRGQSVAESGSLTSKKAADGQSEGLQECLCVRVEMADDETVSRRERQHLTKVVKRNRLREIPAGLGEVLTPGVGEKIQQSSTHGGSRKLFSSRPVLMSVWLEECFPAVFTKSAARTSWMFFFPFPLTGRGTCSFKRHVNEELYIFSVDTDVVVACKIFHL